MDIQDHINKTITGFESDFDLVFHNKSLLSQALTHRSYLVVTGEERHFSNERLEFLGDSILNFTLTEFLYQQYPDKHEGDLSKMKAILVSKNILGAAALKKGYGKYILMNFGEEKSGGRERLSVLSDVYEAVIGAVYLDLGLEKAKDIVYQDIVIHHTAHLTDSDYKNHKSHLLEYIQSLELEPPRYEIISEEGPDHEKVFHIYVFSGSKKLGEGSGGNKKQAEQLAAQHALRNIEEKRVEL